MMDGGFADEVSLVTVVDAGLLIHATEDADIDLGVGEVERHEGQNFTGGS
jgi:hypothetical protein